MARSAVLAHIGHNEDQTVQAVWGAYALKSAFQPIFAFNNGKLAIAAFEGLIRPERDGLLVTPSAFFGGLAGIDRFQVETLARTLHLMNAGAFLPQDTAVFVNFDPSVFIDRSIADAALADMRLTLYESGIDPRRIVCEVTEKKSGSQDTLYDFIQTLKANGFKIAVDDYGAEDSDIERIKMLRPDIVKFDADWITRLMESGAGFGLLSAMVEIFSDQGIATVFEGIEENWQLELAEQSGASMVQGYVLARPELAPTNFGAFPRTALPLIPGRRAAVQHEHRRPAPVALASGKHFGRKISSQ